MAMESVSEFFSAEANLEWLIDLGVTETISERPVNRFDIPDTLLKPQKRPEIDQSNTVVREAPPAQKMTFDPVAIAKKMAHSARNLNDLQAAMQGFEHCDLKHGARNCVFSDGNSAAQVMIIGEAPGRDEDIKGLPFVGRAGQLLDKMFDAIGLSRTGTEAKNTIYITNVLPWRPPQNRDPEPEEIAMMLPFLERHVQLTKPELLILMGNISCQAVLGRKGITRLRGSWTTAWELPVMPMFHPAYLLRNPSAKRETWHDLLCVQDRLNSLPTD